MKCWGGGRGVEGVEREGHWEPGWWGWWGGSEVEQECARRKRKVLRVKLKTLRVQSPLSPSPPAYAPTPVADQGGGMIIVTSRDQRRRRRRRRRQRRRRRRRRRRGIAEDFLLLDVANTHNSDKLSSVATDGYTPKGKPPVSHSGISRTLQPCKMLRLAVSLLHFSRDKSSDVLDVCWIW